MRGDAKLLQSDPVRKTKVLSLSRQIERSYLAESQISPIDDFERGRPDFTIGQENAVLSKLMNNLGARLK